MVSPHFLFCTDSSCAWPNKTHRLLRQSPQPQLLESGTRNPSYRETTTELLKYSLGIYKSNSMVFSDCSSFTTARFLPFNRSRLPADSAVNIRRLVGPLQWRLPNPVSLQARSTLAVHSLSSPSLVINGNFFLTNFSKSIKYRL